MVEIIGHGTYNFIPFDSDELYNRYVDYHRKHQDSIDPDTVGCIAGSDFTVEDLTNENELCANSFDNGEIFPYIADILNNENKCKGFTAFDAPEGCTEGAILYLPQRDIEDHGTCLKGQAVRDIFMQMFDELGWKLDMDTRIGRIALIYNDEQADSLGYCTYYNGVVCWHGFHFVPTKRILADSFREVEKHLSYTTGGVFSREGTGVWNRKEFFNEVEKAGISRNTDTFICMETLCEYVPGTECLYKYED